MTNANGENADAFCKRTLKKQRGFTLIELVIVIAVLGVLMMLIMPQFQNVTKDAKIRTFESNCQAVAYAIGVYQAINNGKYPATEDDFSEYMVGGWKKLKDNPAGAEYEWKDNTFTASYMDDYGNKHNFTFPG